MTIREGNVYDMFVRVLAFNVENALDYAAIIVAAINFSIILAAKEALDEFSAEQTSGEAAAAVEQMSVLRAAIRRKMVAYAKTARAIALSTPGFSELFKVPEDNNDNLLLLATGREFVEEANENALVLVELGKQPGDAAALTADLDAFEAALTAKAEGQQNTVGATAGIDDQTDAGMKSAIILDAIMFNVYRDNPVKLAQWKTARHVRRANQPPPPPPTP